MGNKKLYLKISALVFITVAVISSMAAILVHERQRIREIEAESAEIRQVRRDINAAHRRAPRHQRRPPPHHPACHPRRERHRVGRSRQHPLLRPTPAYRQPAASLEAPLPGLCAPGTDRHPAHPLGGKGNPPAAPDGNPCPSGRGEQPLGEPPARSGA